MMSDELRVTCYELRGDGLIKSAVLSPQCEFRLTTKGWIVGEKVGLTNKAE